MPSPLYTYQRGQGWGPSGAPPSFTHRAVERAGDAARRYSSWHSVTVTRTPFSQW